jgi:hypothetical protein
MKRWEVAFTCVVFTAFVFSIAAIASESWSQIKFDIGIQTCDPSDVCIFLPNTVTGQVSTNDAEVELNIAVL